MDTNKIYRCKGCGANTIFDPATQKMKCEFCNALFSIDEYKDNTNEEISGIDINTLASNNKDQKFVPYAPPRSNSQNRPKLFEYDKASFKRSDRSWNVEETSDMNVYNCSSCNAEIVASNISGTITCPYCDNKLVLVNKFSGDLKPDFIIPFAKTKEDAIKAYYEHLDKSKIYLPKIFAASNHIDEIHAIYVPFWFYDATIQVDYKADGINHTIWDEGLMQYTKHTYFEISRSGKVTFENIPSDSSKKMRDDMMDSIAQYDLSAAKPFDASFLSGFIAEKYDVLPEENLDTIVTRMKKSIDDFVSGSVTEYDQVENEEFQYSISNGKIKYGLMPVWYLNTTYKNKHYEFAMNGQSGQIVSDDLPKNKMKVIYHGCICSLVWGFIFLIVGLIPLGLGAFLLAMIAGPLLGILCEVLFANAMMSSISSPGKASEYSKEEFELIQKNDHQTKESVTKKFLS